MLREELVPDVIDHVRVPCREQMMEAAQRGLGRAVLDDAPWPRVVGTVLGSSTALAQGREVGREFPRESGHSGPKSTKAKLW